MEREIKFRFWTPDKRMIDDHEGWVANIGINEALGYSAGYGYKIMQYTGLKDLFGKHDVYEGDIMHYYWPKDEAEFIGVVQYEPQLGKWIVFNEKQKRYISLTKSGMTGSEQGIFIDNAEVIGNIYENPELLNSDTTDTTERRNDADSSNQS